MKCALGKLLPRVSSTREEIALAFGEGIGQENLEGPL